MGARLRGAMVLIMLLHLVCLAVVLAQMGQGLREALEPSQVCRALGGTAVPPTVAVVITAAAAAARRS